MTLPVFVILWYKVFTEWIYIVLSSFWYNLGFIWDKNIFFICLVTSISIGSCFDKCNFYFHIQPTAIENIALYIEGKLYLYVVYFFWSDYDICMYRSEQQRIWILLSRQHTVARIKILDSEGKCIYFIYLIYLFCFMLLFCTS